ncbi:MAG: glycosyltransferase family 25 protein [Planctomycetia bacterium]|nr:glycosyltransferase family 25 protein [Planctomycetia bacterium]
MKNFFKKIFVISLDNAEGNRRKIQLKEHLKEVGWEFGEMEFVQAIHGDTVGTPNWWKCGGGAWGCYRSHLQILERCINENISPVLILEEDVVFVKDFVSKFKTYIAHLPDDWGLAYLGGQHLKAKLVYLS